MRRLVQLAVVALAAAVVVHWALSPSTAPQRRKQPPTGAREEARPRSVLLTATVVGRLSAPVQDPAATALRGDRTLLMGGLDRDAASVAGIDAAGAGSGHRIGSLPTALHDAAAASDGRSVYLFGGGEPSRDAILRVSASGRSAVAGKLPVPASDVAASRLGGSFYVVGGYTGTRSLDTIVRWRPGGRAAVVARLPKPVRYAAVAPAGGRLVIAGGTNGTAASRVIYTFDPGSNRVRRLGTLPSPVTHAAAGVLAGSVYVLGGRGADQGTQTRRILAVDPHSGRVRAAGRLPRALSDAGAATRSGSILLAGGRDSAGQVRDEVMRLQIRARATAAHGRARIDVYAADRPGALSPVVRDYRPLIYVPNSKSNTVDEIDPRTYKIVRHFAVGALPQHVVPSYDLKSLWVNNDEGNSLTRIDPRTGKRGRTVRVTDPYNLYFAPGGRFALVMAERLKRIDFRSPHTMRLRHTLAVPTCAGVNHADFTADGRYMAASCEFAGRMVLVDLRRRKVVRTVVLRVGGMPQDVKLSPDGRTFYVADMMAGGVWKLSARRFRKTGFLPTGKGAHGLYVSRDSRDLYVSNRGEGSVSVVSFATGRQRRKWRLPGGGSPDMGGVSADGKVLWLAGRYNSEVYAIDTRSGKLRGRMKVGSEPHGLCVYPQPGRYSLGHTGVFR
jgi:DNA-binding beta-propeller fold protein YncE